MVPVKILIKQSQSENNYSGWLCLLVKKEMNFNLNMLQNE